NGPRLVGFSGDAEAGLQLDVGLAVVAVLLLDQLTRRAKKPKGAVRRPVSTLVRPPLLDLGLAELDVLLGDRIVFLLYQLVGHRARILLGHVVVAVVGARHELDLDGDGLGHDRPRNSGIARNLAAEPRKSRKAGFAGRLSH